MNGVHFDPAEKLLALPACDPQNWLLDPRIVFLNHGSFGACPEHALQAQAEWRRRMERLPVLFLVRELDSHWYTARQALAQLVGAPVDDLAL